MSMHENVNTLNKLFNLFLLVKCGFILNMLIAFQNSVKISI